MQPVRCLHCMNSANIALQAAPDDFNPYNARTSLQTHPCKSGPHSAPAMNQIFSRHFAFRYALPISHDIMSKLFRAAIRNATFTLSLDTTLEYVSESGVSVMWPPATNLAFLVKSILTSNMM